MEWGAHRVCKDRAQDRSATGEAPRQDHATYPPPHGGDLANAERRQHVGAMPG